MTSTMLQDTLQTSPPTAGPRFRPYASANHHVTKGRYITSNDPRGYIPVYEYPLNGQWIMMDIDDGYILWTGIWKALGNSKADIVKMIDSQPDLAPLIRRVRGGYLKIQGTWMPYEVALRLSRRVAWPIRDDLIPLFGPTFPSTCLSPDQPGYGQVVASGPNRRRARRSTQTSSSVHTPRDAQANWTVVTPNDPSNSRPPHSSSYLHTAFYPPNRDVVHFHHSYQHPAPPHHGPNLPESPASPAITSRSSVRYSPYSSHAPYPARRPSSDVRSRLTLDIPSLSLRDNSHPPHSRPRDQIMERITLPPILAPSEPDESKSPYALPPISAMEDLRGLHANDSAAVLRRLKSDEPSPPETSRHSDLWRRRSFSSQPYRTSDDREDTRLQVSRTSRSYPDHTYRSRTPSESDGELRHRGSHSRSSGLSLSVPSDTSHDGDGVSTCDPSPISPATPRSSTSSRGHALSPPSEKHPAHMRTPEQYHSSLAGPVTEWPGTHRPRHHDPIRSGGLRHSDADSDTHPLRPW
ncbi:putative DNA-binding domain of Mlu1-box binding protein MBP1 [Lyophyllum shimeji]|uniref:DNA-binding domain of Mlu1-box binding protein MBP1 n=1 Tax=Lyophyllum shimeji TaxID=47721 RepID=A0A9P3Q053_LYOSH|nr:putative DNA-binding domain of Mlu1-box binding protein MBP1 [Lyophyllum shimeji]